MDNQSIPETITLEHNLSNLNLLDSFLIRNHITMNSNINLFWNRETNSWQNTLNFYPKNNKEYWRIIFNANCFNDGNEFTWDISIHMDNVGKKSRVALNFATNNSDAKNYFSSINLNTKTGNLNGASLSGIYSKLIHDDIGVFKKEWLNDPILKIKTRK